MRTVPNYHFRASSLSSRFKAKRFGCSVQKPWKHLQRLQELGCLPFKVDILSLDKDGRLTKILKEKSAKWFKSCKDKFRYLKL